MIKKKMKIIKRLVNLKIQNNEVIGEKIDEMNYVNDQYRDNIRNQKLV